MGGGKVLEVVKGYRRVGGIWSDGEYMTFIDVIEVDQAFPLIL